ncbi:MAG TPA: histidine kinase dimerization/phospho-acceptor domain-containing protein [Acidimicrobiia bacterium]|jgi:signal transduction histidine kinase|nr:histidine kinase dimerization/phospho-acceptor domain-containing protein [Acidimicrobiia bacterium]
MKVRTRVAILLALALLVAGASVALISALTYQHAVYSNPTELTDALLKNLGVTREQALAYVRVHPEVVFGGRTPPGGTETQKLVNDAFQKVQRQVQQDAVNRARLWTIVFIGVLSVAMGVIGWMVAGSMLRPVRLITARARSASASDLSNRVALSGPDDELKQLADTFDDMLARLEQSFVAQRRFSSQVSHELRSPLAVVRNEVELLLPDVEDETIASSLRSIGDAGLRAERLVTALLVLARSEGGNIAMKSVALDEVVGVAVGELVESAGFRGLRVDVELHSVRVIGDEPLLESLVRNLVDNAAVHNRTDGWVRVHVGYTENGAAREGLLEIENSMRREAEDGTGNRVGRTVVQSVVDAHGGSVSWGSPRSGVFLARVVLPIAADATVLPERRDASTHSTDDATHSHARSDVSRVDRHS